MPEDNQTCVELALKIKELERRLNEKEQFRFLMSKELEIAKAKFEDMFAVNTRLGIELSQATTANELYIKDFYLTDAERVKLRGVVTRLTNERNALAYRLLALNE